MTKLPHEDWSVTGVDGPEYELNNMCAVPECGRQSRDRHHIWRRSFLNGDYWWVQVDPDNIVGNCVGLCGEHHHAVTVNAAWIKYENGSFEWSDLFSASKALTWQPPTRRQVEGVEVTISQVEAPSQPAHDHGDGGVCPTCLRPVPVKRDKKEEKRERRTWSVTIPKDNREDGAETIATLIEEGRKELARAGMPYGDSDTAVFFVLTHILALFVQHADEILGDQ